MAIKVYTSMQQGAPTINGVTGSLITALDAILVNGYGQVNVSSITRSGTTATVTTATAHGFSTGDVALITGAAETEYNGEFVVTVTGGTSFTYDVAGSPATPATGTITSKRAPAGFTKTFSGTNKAVYRSNDLSSRRHYYQIIDDGTTSGGSREARLRGYITMSDVDTGVDAFPDSGTYPLGYFITKSSTADSTARQWVVITDGKTVYFFTFHGYPLTTPLTSVGGNYISSSGFGDIIEYKPGDAYASFTTGCPAQGNVDYYGYSGLVNAVTSITNRGASPSTSVPNLSMARDWTGVAGARAASVFGTAFWDTQLGGGVAISYPHRIDNGFYLTPVLVTQGGPSVIRGRMPGFFEPLHGMCFPNTYTIENVQGFIGRKFMMLYCMGGTSTGAVVVDITGPWDS